MQLIKFLLSGIYRRLFFEEHLMYLKLHNYTVRLPYIEEQQKNRVHHLVR